MLYLRVRRSIVMAPIIDIILQHVVWYCPTLLEVFQQGAWVQLQEMEDPELAEIAKQLPETVLRSRASSSTKKYAGAFKRWKTWAKAHKLQVFPAKACHIALYLQHIGNQVKSKSAAEEAVNALSWAHSLAGIDSPAVNPLVQATLQGLKRMLAQPVRKKKPITPEILEQIAMDANKHPTLANLRLAAACLLAYSGFLRFDELIHIRGSDLTISQEMMKIRIPHSKTDQYRQGDEILIARSFSSRCPVAMLEQYMTKGKIPVDDKECLFRGIINTKRGERLRTSGSLSYTTMRELFKKKLMEFGHPAEEFGLHSLRAGGATAAARAGVPDRLFKRHGRWKSETAKDGYVEDPAENRLAVSRNIGL